jgi:hypothetical protein
VEVVQTHHACGQVQGIPAGDRAPPKTSTCASAGAVASLDDSKGKHVIQEEVFWVNSNR